MASRLEELGHQAARDDWEYDWDLESDNPSVWRQQAPPVYKDRRHPAAKISNFRFRGAKNSPEGISLLSIAEQAYSTRAARSSMNS